jgi:hypothetical protein
MTYRMRMILFLGVTGAIPSLGLATEKKYFSIPKFSDDEDSRNISSISPPYNDDLQDRLDALHSFFLNPDTLSWVDAVMEEFPDLPQKVRLKLRAQLEKVPQRSRKEDFPLRIREYKSRPEPYIEEIIRLVPEWGDPDSRALLEMFSIAELREQLRQLRTSKEGKEGKEGFGKTAQLVSQ